MSTRNTSFSWPLTLLAAVLVVLMCRLGFWQIVSSVFCDLVRFNVERAGGGAGGLARAVTVWP